MINMIVFSKNRAMQLQALLTSLKLYYKEFEQEQKNISVIYKATDESFEKGYYKLFEEFPFLNWVKETHLKSNVLNAIEETNPLTMFFVDDDVFKDFWSLNDKELVPFLTRQDVICHSFRLDKNTTWCYPLNKYSKTPEIVDGIWNWTTAEDDWGYPMSISSHLFRTNWIKKIVQHINFENPNYFEGTLDAIKQNFYNMPFMSCYEDSKSFMIPCNRVQNVNTNHYGLKIPYSETELNRLYVEENKIIHIQKLYKFNNSSAQEEVELEFKTQTRNDDWE